VKTLYRYTPKVLILLTKADLLSEYEPYSTRPVSNTSAKPWKAH
jgi:hypothetical protein